MKDQIKKPRPDLSARMEREVKKRWQPQIRAKARKQAAATGGIVIDTRARMGYTAPVGSTDQDRIRHLTVALPPQYAARLFDAQEAGATDQRLQEIAAEGLKEVYFQGGGRRAGSLEEVRFTDIEHLELTCNGHPLLEGGPTRAQWISPSHRGSAQIRRRAAMSMDALRRICAAPYGGARISRCFRTALSFD